MKKSLLIALCCITFSTFSAEHLFTEQPTMMPELAKAGKYIVGVQTIDVVNEKALSLEDFTSSVERNLTLEVWYPASSKSVAATYDNETRLGQAFSLAGDAFRDAPVIDEQQYPLVVLSHGYTGYRTIMFYLAEHLASHGYVVVGIDHTDSTNADIDFEKGPGAGFVSTLINRARDQQFVLEYFANRNTALTNATNTDLSSVIGYSMGGFGAINTIGGCYNFTAEGLQRLGFLAPMAKKLLPVFNVCQAGLTKPDPRWKAMVAFAPWGQALNAHAPSSLADIVVPSLYIAGENDDVSGYEPGVKTLFEQTGSKDTFMLVYENARHNFAPHPAPKVAYATDVEIGHYIEPAWSNEVLTRVNEHMTLAFLNCYIRQSVADCDYLPKRQDSTQEKQADGSLTSPWPGFPDRWGTGMQFYRKP